MTNTCCALISEREDPDIFSPCMFAGSTDYWRFTSSNFSGNRLGRAVSYTLGVRHFQPNHPPQWHTLIHQLHNQRSAGGVHILAAVVTAWIGRGLLDSIIRWSQFVLVALRESLATTRTVPYELLISDISGALGAEPGKGLSSVAGGPVACPEVSATMEDRACPFMPDKEVSILGAWQVSLEMEFDYA